MSNSFNIEESSYNSGLKVLHVIPSVAPCRGGPSKAVIDMVCALRKAGVNAEIATSNDDGESKLDVPLGELVKHNGAPIRFFNRVSPPVVALREFIYSYQFERWLKKNISDYDLVHVHAIFSFCSTKAMQLARRNNIPYIVRPIGQLERWSMAQSQAKKDRYLKLFEKQNLEQASAVHFTAISEQDQALKAIPNLPGKVIPLGLDLPMEIRNARTKMEKRWKLKADVPTILYLSRLHPKKGLELLLEALSELKDLSFQLLVAGDGDADYVESLKHKTKKLKLHERTKFVGFVRSAEKSQLLQGADIYALTSHSENFGIAVLEALASGTAVIVSRQVALAEQVSKHNLGFVTELDPLDIREKLEFALTEIDLTRETGDHARDFVEQHFQWSQIAQRLNNLYKNILFSRTTSNQ